MCTHTSLLDITRMSNEQLQLQAFSFGFDNNSLIINSYDIIPPYAANNVEQIRIRDSEACNMNLKRCFGHPFIL